jgi:hypothetical protein
LQKKKSNKKKEKEKQNKKSHKKGTYIPEIGKKKKYFSDVMCNEWAIFCLAESLYIK